MLSDRLIRLSGANQEVLAHCPSERPKFAGVGGTVLTTAVLASIACTLTLRMFVELHPVLSVALGLGWGLAILNLDRWIVSSTLRQDTIWKNVAIALPRLVLAFVVGLVIAEPLVLSIFSAEINEQAVRARQQEIAARRVALDEEFSTLEALRREEASLVDDLTRVNAGAALVESEAYQQAITELQRLDRLADTAERRTICEGDGTCGTGKVGRGPEYERKQQRVASLKARADRQRDFVRVLKRRILREGRREARQFEAAATARLKEVRAEVARLERERAAAEQEFAVANEASFGLLDRMEALSALAAENGTINAANWVLRLFILALDSLPVLVKLMMSIGRPSLYDRLSERYEDMTVDAVNVEGEHDLEARRIRSSIVVDDAMETKRLATAASKELAAEVVNAQADLARIYIDEWKQVAEAEVAVDIAVMRAEQVARSGSNGGTAAAAPRGASKGIRANGSRTARGPRSGKGTNGAAGS